VQSFRLPATYKKSPYNDIIHHHPRLDSSYLLRAGKASSSNISSFAVCGAKFERSLAIVKPATEKMHLEGAEVAGMHNKHIASLEIIFFFF
jgi:hypothetical protein